MKCYAPERLNALTDGIYAIVMTLLVLEIKPPTDREVPKGELSDELLSQGHVFLAYIVAFVVVGSLWARHHAIFHWAKECSHHTVVLNLLHVLLVTLLPFSSALIGHYHRDQLAIAIFSINLSLASLTLLALNSHIREISSHGPGEKPPIPLVLMMFPESILAIIAIAVSSASHRISMVVLGVTPLFMLLAWSVQRWRHTWHPPEHCPTD